MVAQFQVIDDYCCIDFVTAQCYFTFSMVCRSWESCWLGKKSLLVILWASFHKRGATVPASWKVLFYASYLFLYNQLRFISLWVIADLLLWSLEISISRLKEQETANRKPAQNLKACSFCSLQMLCKWKNLCIFVLHN